MIPAVPPRQRPDADRLRRLPYAVLAISSLVALAAAIAFHVTVRGRDEARFQNAIQSTGDRIENRLGTYVALLLATRGLFAAQGGSVSAEDFREFVEKLDIPRRYPGIQGVGFSRAFPASGRAAVEAEARAGGMDDFRVWPNSPREEMHAIVLLEPLDRRNRAAIGYDMFTEEVRREAMARARDTGQPAASGPVTLVQEIDEHKQAGFLIYVPVYRGARVPPTVEERREKLLGFVYSPFRMDDLLRGVFGSETEPRVGFGVRDREAPATLLHRSGPYRDDAALEASSELRVAGRTWSLDFWSLPPFERGSGRWMWPYVVLLGAGASGLLFALSRAQARAAEQLQIHAQVLESMSEGVSISDERGVILYTNPAEDAMFGYEPGELVGKPVTVQSTYPPAENERFVREVIAELRHKGVWSGEFESVKKDGTVFVTSAHITALTLGGRRYWVCVQQDVTEKKRAERERAALLDREKALRAQAEAASRTKDEFLAMLGHELRNPLAPIVTALALLGRRGAAADGREVSIINRQVTHLKRLVDDLLDVSAITRGKTQLDKKRVEVGAVVGAAVEVVRPLVDERRHALVVEAQPGLFVEADEARLVQVLGNLLHNAAKYTPPGGRIELRAAREGSEVVLRVRDDGQGIPPDALDRLFGLFEQGERGVDRSQGGLGIGLAVVRSLVRLHGGTVEARSDGLGKGSEFVVRLPSAHEPGEASPSRSSPAAPPPDGPARSVLVVDDNADAADMLAELARAAGHEVAVAYDAEQALALASGRGFDVAVLDIGLPGMDGYELAARLRRGGGPTLVAVTGYGQARDRQRAQEAGFGHHLVKPVDPSRLLAILEGARPEGGAS